MSNVHDYLKWRGDLPFSLIPFNTVDNVVFSILAYMDFHEDDNGKTLSEIAERAKEKGRYISSIEAFFSAKLIGTIGNAKRFSDVILEHYENIYDPIQDIQFAAMHFRIDNRTYISFRGTDISVTGWKEDFMMAFTVTHAQELSVRYLNETMDREGQTYYIGGHSKGGNLAVYGSMLLPEEKQKKILRIFNNDGPGLSTEVKEKEGYNRIADKIYRIVPTFSVVGMIYETEAVNNIIVPSTAFGILQHDMCSWQVVPRGFKSARELHPTAARIDETLNMWVDGLDIQERTEFVTSLFDAVHKEGIEYLTDLSNPIKFEMLLLSLLRMPRSSKVAARKFQELAIKNIREDASGYFRLAELRKRGRKKELADHILPEK